LRWFLSGLLGFLDGFRRGFRLLPSVREVEAWLEARGFRAFSFSGLGFLTAGVVVGLTSNRQ